jgi:hypothetical protein
VPLDDALRATFRNFSTLFLLVAAIAVPLHLGHAYVFRQVLAVSELHPAIEALDRGEFVRSVGAGELRRARTSFLVLSLAELALIPVLARGARAIVSADAGTATVAGGLRAVVTRGSIAPRRLGTGALAGALVVAVVIALLARAAGLVALEPIADERAYPWIGLVEGVSRALGGALAVGVLGWAAAEDT